MEQQQAIAPVSGKTRNCRRTRKTHKTAWVGGSTGAMGAMGFISSTTYTGPITPVNLVILISIFHCITPQQLPHIKKPHKGKGYIWWNGKFNHRG